MQLHKAGHEVAIFLRNGDDYTGPLPAIARGFASLTPYALVIDGELVACDERAMPDFRALQFRTRDRAV